MENICVSTQWLSENLANDRLVLLDASMSKVVGKNAITYAKASLIPGSRKFCLESSFCDTDSNTVHAFPSQSQFEQGIKGLGLNQRSIVVVYDNQGIYSSPRAWWIIRAMGFNNVFILDGGLPKWIDENRPVADTYAGDECSQGGEEAAVSVGESRLNSLCDKAFILRNIDNPAVLVVDARAKERYLGLVPEPRQGLRSGHIPNSVNLPFALVLDGFCFKSPERLVEEFQRIIPKRAKQLVFSCGSGVTACIVLAAARLCSYPDILLYDGSWAQWGADHTLPIEN
ncbi:sulfurtransferase [Agaribacterium haliotis]|uniref:sulfurtransferase n=1 Tax=Agaribacterium haliotis TaxID=2013869 RepID=UPI000BB57BE7|nr:sulfurtransferase [Agaribacterium haliotis]